MIILKVRKSWQHVGDTPLFRALVLDGALYYCAFVLALSLETFAATSNEVGGSIPIMSNKRLLV